MKFFKGIRENLKDPKKKSLTLLGIYAIFFVFVFIVISAGDRDKTYNIPEPVTEVSNYEYTYRINNNDVINEVIGTYKDSKDTFNYNGLNYVKENDLVYLNNEVVEIDFDIDDFKYSMIEQLIENSDSITTYKESNKVVYTMGVLKYFDLLKEEVDCENKDCNVINVSITVEKDTYIDKVLIDLSNYYGYKYTIEVVYDNINKIS